MDCNLSGRGRWQQRGEDFMMESEVVPSSLANEIVPILRVANEVEPINSRVAYLCRFYVFEQAHKLDPTSSGRGVRQFKTALLGRLEMENEATQAMQTKQNDCRVLQSFYGDHIRKYHQALQEGDKADRTRLTKAYETAMILIDVLKFVNTSVAVDVPDEILEAHIKVTEKAEIVVPSDILPLDHHKSNQPIMTSYPEVDDIKGEMDELKTQYQAREAVLQVQLQALQQERETREAELQAQQEERHVMESDLRSQLASQQAQLQKLFDMMAMIQIEMVKPPKPDGESIPDHELTGKSTS